MITLSLSFKIANTKCTLLFQLRNKELTRNNFPSNESLLMTHQRISTGSLSVILVRIFVQTRVISPTPSEFVLIVKISDHAGSIRLTCYNRFLIKS